MKKIRKRLYAIDLRPQSEHIYEQKDCLNEGLQCHLNDHDYEGDHPWKGDSYYWHCAEHCRIDGSCWHRGEFWAGCEASDFESTGCCPSCKDEFKSDLGELAEPMKGRDSRTLRKMNINRLSHLSPSFFMGGGLAAPASFWNMMMKKMCMTECTNQKGTIPLSYDREEPEHCEARESSKVSQQILEEEDTLLASRARVTVYTTMPKSAGIYSRLNGQMDSHRREARGSKMAR